MTHDDRWSDDEIVDRPRRGRGWIAGAFVLLVTAALYVAAATYFGDKVPADTRVGGVAVGQRQRDHAREGLREQEHAHRRGRKAEQQLPPEAVMAAHLDGGDDLEHAQHQEEGAGQDHHAEGGDDRVGEGIDAAKDRDDAAYHPPEPAPTDDVAAGPNV